MFKDGTISTPVGYARSLARLGVVATMLVGACRAPNPAPMDVAAPPSVAPSLVAPSPTAEGQSRIDVTPQPDEGSVATEQANDWLVVEKVRDGASEAWVKGDFDPKRNRLTIRTKNVRQFTVDTRRININWDRLVVLSLNGINSELKHRDWTIFRFALDERGAWVILEP